MSTWFSHLRRPRTLFSCHTAGVQNVDVYRGSSNATGTPYETYLRAGGAFSGVHVWSGRSGVELKSGFRNIFLTQVGVEDFFLTQVGVEGNFFISGLGC